MPPEPISRPPAARVSPDHTRWVYNGIYGRQIRAYDLTGVPTGAELHAQARGVSGNLRRLSPSQPLGPWDMTSQTRPGRARGR